MFEYKRYEKESLLFYSFSHLPPEVGHEVTSRREEQSLITELDTVFFS